MCKGFRKVEKTCWVVLLNVQTWGGGRTAKKTRWAWCFIWGSRMFEANILQPQWNYIFSIYKHMMWKNIHPTNFPETCLVVSHGFVSFFVQATVRSKSRCFLSKPTPKFKCMCFCQKQIQMISNDDVFARTKTYISQEYIFGRTYRLFYLVWVWPSKRAEFHIDHCFASPRFVPWSLFGLSGAMGLSALQISKCRF